jgi:RIP metalloprotease RseP
VQRGGKASGTDDGAASFQAAPAVQTIAIKPIRAASNKGDGKSSPQSIGVFLSPNMKKVEKLQSKNPWIAANLAFQYLSDIYTQTLNGILSVLSTFVSGSGPPPGQSISGPIGLIKQGSNVVSTKDWTAVFLFTAALSVNLAVINALPLPALDGGQLVFVIAEAITGRKVDQRLQEGITSVAVLFLLWVSVSAAIGDVGNILSGVL